MPVLSKNKHEVLRKELTRRYDSLTLEFEARELRSPSEGCARGSWLHVNAQCATRGDKVQLGLAVEDFKAILSELKKLK